MIQRAMGLIAELLSRMSGHAHTGSDGSAQITGAALSVWAGTGDIADVTLTEAAGTGTAIPRGDHVHQLGSAVYSASATAATATNTAGVATTVSRGDHGHGVTWAGTGDIADVAGTEGAGAGTTVPRGDHVHAIPSGLITNDMVSANAAIVPSKIARYPFLARRAANVGGITGDGTAYGDGTTPIFDTAVLANAAYSVTTGKFTAPVAGTYLFGYSILMYGLVAGNNDSYFGFVRSATSSTTVRPITSLNIGAIRNAGNYVSVNIQAMVDLALNETIYPTFNVYANATKNVGLDVSARSAAFWGMQVS